MLNTRDEALALLRQYNKEPFHLQHAFTVEGVMAWYAKELGYGPRNTARRHRNCWQQREPTSG